MAKSNHIQSVPLREKLRALSCQLNQCSSMVSVTSEALKHGKTDLELQAANVLGKAAEGLIEIDDVMSALLAHGPL